jgi:hypothetical protein
MARNYGISFCRKGINVLEAIEEELFATVGHGFDKFSRQNMQLLEYRRMLVKFTRERDAGLAPSYDPHVHGSLDQ